MFTLRRATTADLPALHALIDASVRALSRGYYTERQVESALRHVFGPDTRLIADGTYWVVVPDESPATIVAAGGWSRRRTLYGGDQFKDADDPLLDPAVEAARIRAFFVHPDWVRRGLARRLYDRCAADARAAGFRALELGATLPGEPLYRALGFTTVAPDEAAMPDGERLPLLHMRRALDDDTPAMPDGPIPRES